MVAAVKDETEWKKRVESEVSPLRKDSTNTKGQGRDLLTWSAFLTHVVGNI